jgi:hypothetical protein
MDVFSLHCQKYSKKNILVKYKRQDAADACVGAYFYNALENICALEHKKRFSNGKNILKKREKGRIFIHGLLAS